MSQTSAALAPAPGAPDPAGTVEPQPTAGAGNVRDTPDLLRRLSLVLVVTGVLVSLLGTLGLVLLERTLSRAQDDTAQLIRVQKIETDLLVADASATNTFLVGGLESPQRRDAYEQALAEVGSLVAQAARAQPADGAALAALNTKVLDYAATVESARANNRQGFPVGAQYLRQASASLRSDALPVADALVAANAQRAGSAMSTAWGWPPLLAAALGLAVFVVAQVWLARRFHRRINPGLLTGTLVLAVLLISSAVALIALTGSVRLTRDDTFDDVNRVAAARIQANLAKSSESLTLIARGSGQAYEQSWQSSSKAVETSLGPMRDAGLVLQDWRAYATTHQQVRTLDDGGRWDDAVTLATGDGKDSANARFAPVDATLASILQGSGEATASSLGRHRPGLVVGIVLALLAGLAAAWAGRRGVAARLREYR